GRRRAFIRRFKISRLTFRELASSGLIPGVTKSSWERVELGVRMPGCIRVMSISFSSFGLLLAVSTAVTDHWDSVYLVLLKFLVIAALVALNGFFVAAEFALVKVRRSQLDTLAAEGDPRAAT